MPAKKVVAKATPAKKATPKKATAKKAAAKKATAKKTVAKKAVAKKAVAKKAAAKKAAPKKAAVKKAAPKKASTTKGAPKKVAAKKVATKRAAPPPPPPPPRRSPSPVALVPPDTEPTVVSLDAPTRAPGVTVSFEGPQPLRRLTVAFRIILAIPHLLWLVLLWIPGFFAVIIAWFAALFTGRVPDGIATFVARLIQYGARVSAYTSMFFHDRYPSFSLDAEDGAVTMQVGTTKLNRLAVFFRWLLVIPGWLVFYVLSQGLRLAVFFIWLIALIRGRIPQSLFEAQAAILRYRMRLYAYATMLTGTYPSGLFGDQAGEPDTTTPADAPLALPVRPRITRLLLSRAAKRIIVVLLVLGAVSAVTSTAISAMNIAESTATERKLDDYHDDLLGEVQRSFQAKQSCAFSGGIECLHSNDARLSAAFTRFVDRVETLEFFEDDIDDVELVLQDSEAIAGLLDQLFATTDQATYQQLSNRLIDLLGNFDDHYDELKFQL